MIKKSLLIIIALGFVAQSIFGQEVWSLERCVRYAQDNSRMVKQSQVQIKSAQLNNKQYQMQVYPSVSAGSNLGLNFGRSVNPSTYSFQTSTSSYNSWSLNASVPIYQGGLIRQQIHQTDAELQATRADLEQTQNSLALQVAQAYLQILLNEEQLANSKRRAEQDVAQADKVDKQIRAGALAQNARLDMKAQMARSEQQVVIADNNVELSYLNLKTLLELPVDQTIKVEKPNVALPTDVGNDANVFKSVYTQALGYQPYIKAAEWRIKSAEFGLKAAEAQLKPSLYAQGSLSTNYSNSIRDFSKDVYSFSDAIFPLKIDGKQVNASTTQPQLVSQAPTTAYLNQLGNNFGQGVGLSLQIPIFSGLSRQINVQRQQLNIENQTIALEKSKLQLRGDVATAITNAKAARKQFDVAQKTYDAYKAAFEAIDKRFAIGNANSFELTQAKINVDTAERDVTVAKYDFIFKLKIIDFYQGKKLMLN